MNEKTKDGIVAIEAVMLAIYNQPSAFIKGVYSLPTAQGDYFESKMNQSITNFGRWWNTLDASSRKCALNTALRMYGNEAAERVENY